MYVKSQHSLYFSILIRRIQNSYTPTSVRQVGVWTVRPRVICGRAVTLGREAWGWKPLLSLGGSGR